MEGTVSEPNDWNAGIVAEFRANEGRVGGQFEGSTLLLLHTVGRRSGIERINPLAYFADGERYLIVASKGGHPSNPDWVLQSRGQPAGDDRGRHRDLRGGRRRGGGRGPRGRLEAHRRHGA